MRMWRKQSNNAVGKKEQILEALSMPKDITMGYSTINVMGNRELWIENYKGILEYQDTKIKLKTKTGHITVTGKKLNIEYYSSEDMKIVGEIEQITFS